MIFRTRMMMIKLKRVLLLSIFLTDLLSSSTINLNRSSSDRITDKNDQRVFRNDPKRSDTITFSKSNKSSDVGPTSKEPIGWNWKVDGFKDEDVPKNFSVPVEFPIDWFDGYYNDPKDKLSQPQPIIRNPITKVTYPLNLTSPYKVPIENLRDPITLPPIKLRGSEADLLAKRILQKVIETINSSTGQSNCSKCLKSLSLMGELSKQSPQLVPETLVKLCELYRFDNNCEKSYGLHSLGPIVSQVLSFADLEGYDGQNICFNFFSKYSQCELPSVSELDLGKFIKSSKPKDLVEYKNLKRRNNADYDEGSVLVDDYNRFGKQALRSKRDRIDSKSEKKEKRKDRLKILHISDFHLDPRYQTGSESDCKPHNLCCRIPAQRDDHQNFNETIKSPAPRFGAYRCDTPLALGMAAVQAIPVLTGTDKKENGFDFIVYTGDLVAHDQTWELSRDYVEYIESLLFENWKDHLGGSPVYVAIGNHDSYLQAQDAPHSLMPERLSKQFSWNYNHLSKLWLHNDWISKDVSDFSRTHYGGYSVERFKDLKIITLNTDFWYRANMFNYINMTDPDQSGMLKFLIDELEKSESKFQSVWIVGHVLSGWDGSNPLQNPTNLFYQIVERFSPHVIKTILWGHTHEDQFQIFYKNNATNVSLDDAIATAWIGPSITPLTNLNSGFRMYEVDPESYEILDAHTWYSDISKVSKSSSNETKKGKEEEEEEEEEIERAPIYEYEYSTRETYGKAISSWGLDDPLNSTWWHLVTEKMLNEIDRKSKNSSTKIDHRDDVIFQEQEDEDEDGLLLMEKFTRLQGKRSIKTYQRCNDKDCIESKVCYMRSGSSPIGKRCKQGYGSVQS